MATWSEIINGETLASIRGKINAFNNTIKSEVTSNTSATSTLTGTVGTLSTTVGSNTSDISTINTTTIPALTTRVSDIEDEVVDLNTKRQVAFLSRTTVNTLNLTSTPQALTGYTDSYSSSRLSVNTTTGVISTLSTISGPFEVAFTAEIGFTSDVSTRTFTIELYNNTTSTTVASMNINIARDATVDSESLVAIFNLDASTEYVLRAMSTPDMASTSLNFTSFSMKYIGE